MMNETLLTLLLLAVALFALTALMFFYSRAPWLLKIIVVVALPVFYFYSWQGWKAAQGWPSKTELPQQFMLHSAIIEEPDASKLSDGKVQIWLTDLSNDFPAVQPRAYEIAYTRPLHSTLDEALRNMRNGHIQLGTRIEDEISDAPPKDFSRLGEQRYQLKFSKLPDPALPEK